MIGGWTAFTLAELCSVVTDGSHFSPPAATTGMPYVTVRDVADGVIDFEGAARIADSDFNQLEANGCRPLPGDVLFSKDGTVGRVAVVRTEQPFVVLSSLAILRPRPDVVDSSFLGLALTAPQVITQIVGSMTGTALRRVTLRNLKPTRILVPPLDDQRRIVAILEDHLLRLDVATASLVAASRRAGLLLSSALARLARPDDRVVSLGDLADIGTGSTPSRSDSSNYDGGTIPWVSSGDISQGRIVQIPRAVTTKGQAVGRLKIYPAETLVLAMYGEGKTRGTVGRLGLAAAVNQACAAVQVRDPGQLDWIESVLRSNYSVMRRMAAGGVQPNLNLSLVRAIRIPLPGPIEREARLEQLGVVEESVARIRASVTVSDRRRVALRRSLLAAAFRGELPK